MMWAYAVKAKEVHATDISSNDELHALEKDADWLWIDCFEPNPEEFQLVSELLCPNTKMLEDMKKSRTFPRYKKQNDCTLLSISVAAIKNELKTYPIYIGAREKVLVTVRNSGSAKPVERAIQTLRDCVEEMEKTDPAFVVCEVLRETSNENLEAMMALREIIESVEEEVIAKPSRRGLAKKVFALKREIAVLYRLLWSEEQIMSSLKDGLIPNLEPCEESVLGLGDAMGNISRELEFLSSYDSALDGVLTIQDLGMIHRVETTLIYLTIVIIIMNLILIIIEMSSRFA
jgi:Mg2+ and Co2+ transporter CorA